MQKIPNAFHILHFVPPHFKPLETLTVCFILALFIISAYSVSKHFYRNIIRIRRYFQLLFFLMLFALLSLLLTTSIAIQSICIVVIPLSIFFSYFFLQLKKKAQLEVAAHGTLKLKTGQKLVKFTASVTGRLFTSKD